MSRGGEGEVVPTRWWHECDGTGQWRRLGVAVPGCIACRDCARQRVLCVPRPGVAVRGERATTWRDRGSRACTWDAVLAPSHTGRMRYSDLGRAWRARRAIWDHPSAAAGWTCPAPDTCETPIWARRGGRGVRSEITRRPRPGEPVPHRIRAEPRSGRGVKGAASDLRSPVVRGPVNWKLCNLQQYCKSIHRQFHAWNQVLVIVDYRNVRPWRMQHVRDARPRPTGQLD